MDFKTFDYDFVGPTYRGTGPIGERSALRIRRRQQSVSQNRPEPGILDPRLRSVSVEPVRTTNPLDESTTYGFNGAGRPNDGYECTGRNH